MIYDTVINGKSVCFGAYGECKEAFDAGYGPRQLLRLDTTAKRPIRRVVEQFTVREFLREKLATKTEKDVAVHIDGLQTIKKYKHQKVRS